MASPDRALVELVERALEEDSARNDVTTMMTVGSGVGRASVVARSEGVVSGHRAARLAYGLLDGSVEYVDTTPDADPVRPGGIVARIEGPMGAILAGERTALNFLQHLSGVATLTSRFVALVEGTGIRILDTRKTTPGLRFLEKEAVVHGGGLNHRRDLSELVLVKENHIAAAGGLDAIVEKLGEAIGKAEIEVTSIEELRKLEENPPWRIMLDNFSPEMVAAALEELGSWQPRPCVEISGGITLDSIGRFALRGVDFISVGSLTSSAPSIDMSMRVSRGV